MTAARERARPGQFLPSKERMVFDVGLCKTRIDEFFRFE